jgi:5-formyltetrahydrofolate cyclo-ligase
MSADEVAKGSAAVADRVFALPAYAHAPAVLTYVASLDNEVDTRPLIRTAVAEGRNVLVPIARHGGRMDWSLLESVDDLVPSRFGVLEPAPGAERLVPVPPDSIALVPGLLFTARGDRLGYGGGYYDRFLATYRGIAVGLAFELQLAPSLPVEAHDVPLPCIVTESRTLRGQESEPPPD